MEQSKEAFAQILNYYRPIIEIDVADYLSGKALLKFPFIPKLIINVLCDKAADIFQSEPIILKVPHDCIIVGDLHGHILDLLRIFKTFGLPPEQKYLFLGDYVDRGEFSTETMTLLFTLKALYPNEMYMIRGNHEFAEMTNRCGFSTELYQIYGDTSMETAFLFAFSMMPLAATINEKILCIHGGIGPNFKFINQINSINRPLYDFDHEPAATILWSDPSENVSGYMPSQRGSGAVFGRAALDKFMEDNKIDLLVRAHECASNGVAIMLGGKLMTVFAASYYCGIAPNLSGVVQLTPDGEKNVVTFAPLDYFLRSLAHHVTYEFNQIVPFKPPRRHFDQPLTASSNARLPRLANILRSFDESNTGRPAKMKLGNAQKVQYTKRGTPAKRPIKTPTRSKSQCDKGRYGNIPNPQGYVRASSRCSPIRW